MTTFEIPLETGAQSFTVNLGGNVYKLRLIYRNAVGGGWFLDIERPADSSALYGIPLLVNIDLLAQHQHRGFGHLMATLDGDESGQPTYEDMGITLHLYWSEEGWS